VKIYVERTRRHELAKLIRALEPGDVLIVTSVERLARSTGDLLNVLNAVAKQEAGFRSLSETWADTTTPDGRLVLTVVGGVGEFERELFRARAGEGRKRAQARGVKFGRAPSLTAAQRREALQRLAAGETRADVARTYGVGPKTIGRLRPFGDASDDAPS
jgi:DNA invertase Pin-like site-specific DNA recombinase